MVASNEQNSVVADVAISHARSAAQPAWLANPMTTAKGHAVACFASYGGNVATLTSPTHVQPSWQLISTQTSADSGPCHAPSKRRLEELVPAVGRAWLPWVPHFGTATPAAAVEMLRRHASLVLVPSAFHRDSLVRLLGFHAQQVAVLPQPARSDDMCSPGFQALTGRHAMQVSRGFGGCAHLASSQGVDGNGGRTGPHMLSSTCAGLAAGKAHAEDRQQPDAEHCQAAATQ